MRVGGRRTSPRFVTHPFQVRDVTRNLGKDYLNRSTFGYVGIFNLLPEIVFHSHDYDDMIPVKEFQKNLSRLLKFVSTVAVFWSNLYNPRIDLYNHMLKDYRNVGFDELLSQEQSR